MKKWLITIPKTIKWENYQKELDAVKDHDQSMHYRVRAFPKDMRVGDRCYVTWNGKIRGWMYIMSMDFIPTDFKCSTTEVIWRAGAYITRSGPFHMVDGILFPGFRGIRRLE